MFETINRAGTSSIIALAATCLLLACGFQSQAQEHAAVVTPKMAGEIFAQSCSTCHVAPDLAYATDRAWLEQVKETA